MQALRQAARQRGTGSGALLAISIVLTCSAAPAPAQTNSPAPAAQHSPVQTRPVPPTPIAVKKIELGEGNPWNPAWNRMLERTIPRDLLSRKRAPAVAPLCPRFASMSRANRRAFWAYFFQALAGAEAGLLPTADVMHNDPQVAVIDSVTHRTVRQEGLLQLTYMDSIRYGCDFNWAVDRNLPEHNPAKTILQPRNNLLCGIKIIRNQLIRQHKPLLTESSYWVTLRPQHPSFRIFLKQMANVPAACGSPLRKPTAEEAAPSEAESARPARERHRDSGFTPEPSAELDGLLPR